MNRNLTLNRFNSPEFLWVLIVILVIILMIRSCRYNDFTNNLTDKDVRIELDMPKVSIKRSIEDSSIIAIQKQFIIDADIAHKVLAGKLDKEIGKLKKVNNYLEIQNQYLVEKTNAPYTSEPEIISQNNSDYIKIPFTDSIRDKWHNLKITLKKHSWDYTMGLSDSSKIIIGTLKRGFFKSSEPSVIYKNENPYISGFSMSNIKVNYKKPFYERRLFNIGLGIALAFGTQKLINTWQTK